MRRVKFPSVLTTVALLVSLTLLVLSVAPATPTYAAALATGPVPPADQLSRDFLANKHPRFVPVGARGGLNGQGHARFGIPNIDSLPNWNDHFFAAGFDSNGNPQREWFTNTVGNPPPLGGTTTINAPIVPVAVHLLNYDGSPRYVNGQPLVSDPAPYVSPVLSSPLFQNATYSSSSTPTQFTDAIQRAEYAKSAKPDWHTVLAPSVKTPQTLNLIRGTYYFALNGDGTCCAFILIDWNAFNKAMFPPGLGDTSTVIGAAETAGDVTTKDMSTFLFPDTYLYLGDPSICCVLGYHSYDYEPGDASNRNAERRYVLNYSSWVSSGLFGGGWEDVVTLSHEIAETYNDPFVTSDNIHDITPWWLAPDGSCGNYLETGDVVENLPNAVYPMTMNNYTYHLQNEALLQYFEFQQPSSALHGAYTYPDESLITAPSAPQRAGCQ